MPLVDALNRQQKKYQSTYDGRYAMDIVNRFEFFNLGTDGPCSERQNRGHKDRKKTNFAQNPFSQTPLIHTEVIKNTIHQIFTVDHLDN